MTISEVFEKNRLDIDLPYSLGVFMTLGVIISVGAFSIELILGILTGTDSIPATYFSVIIFLGIPELYLAYKNIRGGEKPSEGMMALNKMLLANGVLGVVGLFSLISPISQSLVYNFSVLLLLGYCLVLLVNQNWD